MSQLRDVRQNNGWSQPRLAVEAGMSPLLPVGRYIHTV